MRTTIIDEILRRIDGRQSTEAELEARRERLRRVAQLVGEIAEPSRSRERTKSERQFG